MDLERFLLVSLEWGKIINLHFVSDLDLLTREIVFKANNRYAKFSSDVDSLTLGDI